MRSFQETVRLASVALFVPMLAGCAEAHFDLDAETSESTVTSLEAIGETSCTTASPDARLQIHIPEHSLDSTTLYSNPRCSKAYIVEPNQALPRDPWGDMAVIVGWADMWRRNRDQCVNGKLTVQLMSRPISGWTWRTDRTVELPLQWDEERQACQYRTFVLSYDHDDDDWSHHAAVHTPSAHWGESATPLSSSLNGRVLKIAASARTPRGTTQPLYFTWVGPEL